MAETGGSRVAALSGAAGTTDANPAAGAALWHNRRESGNGRGQAQQTRIWRRARQAQQMRIRQRARQAQQMRIWQRARAGTLPRTSKKAEGCRVSIYVSCSTQRPLLNRPNGIQKLTALFRVRTLKAHGHRSATERRPSPWTSTNSSKKSYHPRYGGLQRNFLDQSAERSAC